MEVHHHPHVEKKSFKEYLLEGLMIFIAVTMGFFAESFREHITDNGKEKEFIISMIEDAQTDIVNINEAFSLNKLRSLHLDSLAVICINYNAIDNADSRIYRLYRYGLIHPAFISPTERTMQQLKNSGGMRLIKRKTAVDSIILYDNAAKKLADQQAYYELYQNESAKSAVSLFNFQKLGFSKIIHISDKDSSFQLLTHDKILLAEFSNRITIYSGVVGFYNIRLLEMKAHAVNLIETLKKEYKLE